MSKHSSADDKLHVSPEVRANKSRLHMRPPASKAAPQAPPKGTNANNQYH